MPKTQIASSLLPGPATSPNALATTLKRAASLPQTKETDEHSIGGSNSCRQREGHEGFSEFMSSGSDFFIFRRFDNINARIILWLRDQIIQRGERLDALHEGPAYVPNRGNDGLKQDAKHRKERERLMSELSRLVHKYSKSPCSCSRKARRAY